MTKPSWWDEGTRVAELIECVDLGMTSSQIARRLGTTRNAVIGKVSRLKLKLTAPAYGGVKRLTNNTGGPPKSKKSAPLPPEKPIEPCCIHGDLVTEENIRRNMCRYPHGDPSMSDFHYCGHATKERSQYCPYHHAACYTPNVKKDGNR